MIIALLINFTGFSSILISVCLSKSGIISHTSSSFEISLFRNPTHTDSTHTFLEDSLIDTTFLVYVVSLSFQSTSGACTSYQIEQIRRELFVTVHWPSMAVSSSLCAYVLL